MLFGRQSVMHVFCHYNILSSLGAKIRIFHYMAKNNVNDILKKQL